MKKRGMVKKGQSTGIAFLNARLLLCSPVWLFGIFLILFFLPASAVSGKERTYTGGSKKSLPGVGPSRA